MDEDLAIINTKTRNEKIKNFFVDNKKTLITISLLIVAILISFYSFQIYKEKQKEHLSKKYNNAVISFNNGDKSKTLLLMKEVIENKDNTYSPLALYFLIDNNLIENKKEINNFFNLIINKVSLENEIRNLIIYKKALFNADVVDENQLIDILKPVINSKSVWRSHALYLIAEYFYSKNEKQKSKEFFSQILNVENANQDIIKEAQKRLNRDLSE
ncbi:hypothetical protein OAI89_02590 [Candidatus Pelagibacter sp.]|nr:hypothetical protein [Candidatus Pelagibacter sp.]